MIVSNHPRHKGFPPQINDESKLAYIVKGKVSVGKFSRLINNNFVDFYLPRLHQMNFLVNKRRFKHPGYKTADQAYSTGKVLMAKFNNELYQKKNNAGYR